MERRKMTTSCADMDWTKSIKPLPGIGLLSRTVAPAWIRCTKSRDSP